MSRPDLPLPGLPVWLRTPVRLCPVSTVSHQQSAALDGRPEAERRTTRHLRTVYVN
ncbi:hypothetical protein [Streptomyces spirodelae]|uniref:Uncharacterized protein n=1 Tax=Streptomyces spirodelae TaxID=2812904 RepID=A0ABS3WT40_9ACTN|nr:hypothetical protein [Streptomyces spirodelae]MBO8186273.1 hypothetical protein [Streptomyces spirodelae]